MAKTFYTSGTGSQQTLTGSQNEKVAVYQTFADAEADLANLEAGQIVATPDTGDENAQPVDVIQAGNMHAVTSNAVANSNAMPVNSVTSGNLHSVTSNAVFAFTLNSLIDLLSHSSILIVNAPSGAGQNNYYLGSISVSEDTKIRFLYWQENTLTSNTRNTLYLREVSTGNTRYQRATTNNRLGRGWYIWDLQLYANITYNFGLWCADLSNACTYSNFSAIPF